MDLKKSGQSSHYLNEVFRKVFYADTGVISFPARLVFVLTACLLTFFYCGSAAAQSKSQMVRLAKLEIDPAQLERYTALLKEEIEASVRLEPGVLTLYAVAEKDNPTHITILEIYASEEAYKSHIQTPHFLKYKNGSKEMVKALKLVNTVPLIPEMKIK